ncbi:hypothetical protein IG631_05556 [Alternaria alternata]|nr:hypothetical protein IG631_05556 [Alternaria alternata]
MLGGEWIAGVSGECSVSPRGTLARKLRSRLIAAHSIPILRIDEPPRRHNSGIAQGLAKHSLSLVLEHDLNGPRKAAGAYTPSYS